MMGLCVNDVCTRTHTNIMYEWILYEDIGNNALHYIDVEYKVELSHHMKNVDYV